MSQLSGRGGSDRKKKGVDEDYNRNNNRSFSSSIISSGSGDADIGTGNTAECNSGYHYTTKTRKPSTSDPSSFSASTSNIEAMNDNNAGTTIPKSKQPTSNTSNTHRLSSIEILNENRQRQLQFKQQESFKLHLEQRQKLIQQQQLDNKEANLGVTYQVNTSAPDYMASAVANNAVNDADKKKRPIGPTATVVSGGIAVNPFDEEHHRASSNRPQQQRGAANGRRQQQPGDLRRDEKKPAKNGFIAALTMDEASFVDDELGSNQPDGEINSAASKSQLKLTETRYTKVASGGTSSYNYDEDPSKKPFFYKDFATLLQDCRASRKLVIMIVAIALLLDNMLLTSVVPIIPAYLYKLRIERQHRELLQSNKSLFTASSEVGSKLYPGNGGGVIDSGGGPFDYDKFNTELERRINQSMAAVKGRFSSSVFQPRVHVKPTKQQHTIVDSYDDRREKDDVDNDDNDEHGQIQLSRQTTKHRATNFARRKQDQSSRQSDGDDEYIDATEKEDTDDKKIGVNGDDVRPITRIKSGQEDKDGVDGGNDGNEIMKVSKPRKLQSGRRKSLYKRPPSAIRLENLNDDGDDEDMASSQRWTKLKDSLVSMARVNGNDTDALGGMCLSMVLGRSKDADIADDYSEVEEDSNQQEQQPQPNQRSSQKINVKSRNEAKGGNDQNRAGKRPERSPRIERLMPKVIKPKGVISRTENDETTNPTNYVSKNKQQTTPVLDKEEPTDEQLIISHQDIVDESFEVGVMFASKPIVQAFANPFIGTLTNKVGFTIPMFTGFVIMFLSTLVFAFGSTYSTLFIARAIQGVGSACTSVAGMSMLADRFPDDAERGNAMAIALGGLALGVVIGPPFGGFMYEFVGKSSPFIVLSILALLDGLLQLMVLQPRVTENQEEGPSLMTLIKDPYILVAAGAITFANTGIAILEPALPLWMMDTMQAKNWEQGVAFLPAALSYLFGTNLFGNLGHKIGRWRATMIGLIIIGCSLLLIPFATRVDHLIIPNGAIGFAMGMVDSTMMPMLGYLVDIRHTSVYGSVYAIGDVAFCASFAFGPALSGTLVELVGFEGLIITTAFICFAFAPLLLLLRNPPARPEAQLQEQSALRYVNYNHLDSPDEEAGEMTNYKSTAKIRDTT